MEIKVSEFTVEFVDDYGMKVSDLNGRVVHTKASNGFEDWIEYHANGVMCHYRNIDGIEFWFNPEGVTIPKIEYDLAQEKA